MSTAVLGPSMKPVTWDTWLWWKCWCPGEPCWTRLATRTILPFTMLFEMDTSPSPNCSCSSGPRRTSCKSTETGMHVQRIMRSCLLVFTCSDFHHTTHSPHTSVFGTSEIFKKKKKKSLWQFVCQYLWFWNCVALSGFCVNWCEARFVSSALSVKADLWKVLGAVKKGTREVLLYSLLD